MTATQKQAAIIAAWRAAPAPLSASDAKSLALEVLADYPKQRGEFAAWFDKYGDAILGRIVRV